MKKRYSLLNGQEPAEFRQKLKIVIALLLIAISILLVRLGYLQIIRGAEFKQKSENNSVCSFSENQAFTRFDHG